MVTEILCFCFIRNASVVVKRDLLLEGKCPINPLLGPSASCTHLCAVSLAFRLRILVYPCGITCKTKTMEKGPGVVANGEQQVRSRAWETRLSSNRADFKPIWTPTHGTPPKKVGVLSFLISNGTDMMLFIIFRQDASYAFVFCGRNLTS